ncbi:MAG: RNA polymerase sigma factor [Eubacteriales bacterium]
MSTDEELIREIQLGSHAAMEVLVKRYYKMIFSYVYRKLGDYHEAYDITQEIFIKMMKHINNYKESSKFKNWLFKIGVNSCNDYFRSRGFQEKNSTVELKPTLKDDQGNIWDLLSRNLDRKRIKEAIEELPDHQRDALILKFYHDFKIKDIAKITDTKEATVKSRLKQGLDKLDKIINGGGKLEEKRNRI